MKKLHRAIIGLLAMAVVIALAGCPAVVQKTYSTVFIDNRGLNGDLEVVAYYPAISSGDPQPLIIFSHGLEASPEFYRGLLYSLAERGYVVLAPQHQDDYNFFSLDGLIAVNWETIINDRLDLLAIVGQIAGFDGLDLAGLIDLIMFQAETAQIDNAIIDDLARGHFYYRIIEMNAVLDLAHQLNNDLDSGLFYRIDESNIGLVGHSLGGLTIIPKITPGDPDYDERIKAGVLMSPASAMFDVSPVTIPTCWMTGTLDNQNLRDACRSGYDQVSGPAEFIDFLSVGHSTFADVGARLLDIVADIFPALRDRAKMIAADDFIAAENWQEKCGAIDAAAMDWLDYWLKGIGSFDAYLESYSAIVSVYENKN